MANNDNIIYYNKRAGTTGGAQGHEYETKLIAVILFRLLHNRDIENFYLASNYDEVGAFDDICLKVNITGRNRPISVFIQVKHKEDDDSRLEYDLIKQFFESFLKVKKKFNISSKIQNHNDYFSGEFDDTDCIFILYTNAKYYRKSYDCVSDGYDVLHKILATGSEDSNIFQIGYINNEEEEEITALAEHFTKFLNNKSMNIMMDDYILRYHVILAQSVVHISDVQAEDVKPNHKCTVEKSEWRSLVFRPDFFYTNDKFLIMLKEKIIKQILNNKLYKKKSGKIENKPGGNVIASNNSTKSSSSVDLSPRYSNSSTPVATFQSESTIEEQITEFLSKPSAMTLSPLIETHIIYENDELKFSDERSSNDVQKLKQVNVPTGLIEEARAINMLVSLRLNVPVTFGNIDLPIRNNKKGKSRLDHLFTKIDELCDKAISTDLYKVVTVKQKDGFDDLKGNLGGAVGNLFVYDEATKCLMFTENSTLLQENARYLFDKMISKRNNLHLYRFNVNNIIACPKLVFDCSNEMKEIFKKVKVFVFEKQSNHKGVEEILINEIAQNQRLLNNSIKFDDKTIFLYYHSRVEEWWMEKKISSFLTRTNNLYQEAFNNIVEEPHMSMIHNMFYQCNIEYFKCDFTKNSMQSLKLIRDHSTIIVITDIPKLTTVRVLRWLRHNYNNTSISIVDLECVSNLPDEDFKALNLELKNTKKTLIIVCNTRNSRNYTAKNNLSELAKGTKNIFVANKKFYETLQDYFDPVHVIINHGKQSITYLTMESQKDIIKDATVLFQGQLISLGMIIDDNSVACIKGSVLEKILCKKVLNIGKSFKDEKSNKRYEEMKRKNETYIDRRICRTSNILDIFRGRITYGNDFYTVTTFDDIDDDVVLLASSAGMGKSLLLTHMSHKTKELAQCKQAMTWIVRINLLEHTDKLKKWDKAVLNTSMMLIFLCQVTLHNYNTDMRFEEIDKEIKYSKGDGEDDEAILELNLFLYFYTTGKLILLFDGFDEICPNYQRQVINLFKLIKNDIHKIKMWVTSRTYAEIQTELKATLGESYEIECVDHIDQQMYLETFWKSRIPLQKSIVKDRYQSVVQFIPTDGTLIQIYKILENFLDLIEGNKCFDYETVRKEYFEKSKETNEREEVNLFSGRPLHLYLAADYFANLINDFDEKELKTNINEYRIFERFIENKLSIFFEDKHGVKMSDPFFGALYEKELKRDMYKKIGAYAIFQNTLFDDEYQLVEFKDKMEAFNEETKIKIEELITTFNSTEDKSGLISYVTSDNVPIFVHATFAEYFATEYLLDFLKNSDTSVQVYLYSVMNLYHEDMYTWTRKKMDLDTEIRDMIINIESHLLSCHSPCVHFIEHEEFTIEQNIRIYISSVDDYESDIIDFFKAIFRRHIFEDDEVTGFVQKQFLARMKPHLKAYFPTAPSVSMPLPELIEELPPNCTDCCSNLTRKFSPS